MYIVEVALCEIETHIYMYTKVVDIEKVDT